VNIATLKIRIERFSIPEPNSGCWLWTGSPVGIGYGRIRANGRHWLAHRASWRVHRGRIPRGRCVLHRCDTPACVNPDHLFLGSLKDNAQDALRKGRNFFATTRACPRGHLYDERNTRYYRGARHCRACDRLRRGRS
jgi:hypothetical protein